MKIYTWELIEPSGHGDAGGREVIKVRVGETSATFCFSFSEVLPEILGRSSLIVVIQVMADYTSGHRWSLPLTADSRRSPSCSIPATRKSSTFDRGVSDNPARTTQSSSIFDTGTSRPSASLGAHVTFRTLSMTLTIPCLRMSTAHESSDTVS